MTQAKWKTSLGLSKVFASYLVMMFGLLVTSKPAYPEDAKPDQKLS
jgi:hypothetical protein